MRRARTCPWIRIRPYCVLFRGQSVFFAAQSSADCIINMFGFDYDRHRHGRRHILWFGVTAHPTAEWIANQVTQACRWEQPPRYLIRDRDGACGEVFIRRLRSIGIRDRPTSPRSPWQNGYAERLIGSIRRECLDHVVVFGERHLRHIPVVHELSQRDPEAFIFGERCADLPRRRTSRTYSLPPNFRRAAPPICPDLICDRHN
jgi:transposase InsO family protein